MVKPISKQMKQQLDRSLTKWRGEVSFKTTEFYNQGDCDICSKAVSLRLARMKEWFPLPRDNQPPGDPPWLFCEEHGKEFGLAW